MNNLQNDTKSNNKIELIKELLKKQIIDEEKKKNILFILNYLEYQESFNKDDIYLKEEMKLLYDCIL